MQNPIFILQSFVHINILLSKVPHTIFELHKLSPLNSLVSLKITKRMCCRRTRWTCAALPRRGESRCRRIWRCRSSKWPLPPPAQTQTTRTTQSSLKIDSIWNMSQKHWLKDKLKKVWNWFLKLQMKTIQWVKRRFQWPIQLLQWGNSKVYFEIPLTQNE